MIGVVRMELGEIVGLFERSPAIRLLRSPNAPFIIDFFNRQFKVSGAITVEHEELLASLRTYMDEVQESYPERFSGKPENYLSEWRSGDTRWLLRFHEAGSNAVRYQLTSFSEQVLSFLDRMLNQAAGFIGTESRLQLIVGLLQELTIGASNEPNTRLEHLKEEQRRIQAEIETIESGGVVSRFSPAKIREQFATALSLLKQLQGDFRAVEEQFKGITRQVQQRQIEARQTRGDILGFALDSEDLLKREDQGVSFYEFVRLILSPQQREKLEKIIALLVCIDELTEQSDGLDVVRRMIPSLLAEAEKVMRTNQRLTATLRRLLDERTQGERRRVAQLLHEIQGLMTEQSAEPPRGQVGLEVEERIGIASPMSRGFWAEPMRFDAIDLMEAAPDQGRLQEAFAALAKLQRLDWRRMRARIADAVDRRSSLTLGELLAETPPTGGVVEVLGYLQIACEDHHPIDRDKGEEVVLPQRNGLRLALTLPLVRFAPIRKVAR